MKCIKFYIRDKLIDTKYFNWSHDRITWLCCNDYLQLFPKVWVHIYKRIIARL